MTHALEHLKGTAVPGGSYTIAAYENWLAHDAMYSTPIATPHPIMAFIGAQRGMGLTVAELFALFDSNIDDGPVLAETAIGLEKPLQTDIKYRVSGEVVDLVRKHGKTMGAFDLVTCRFELHDPKTDDVVASVSNVYAISRETQ